MPVAVSEIKRGDAAVFHEGTIGLRRRRSASTRFGVRRQVRHETHGPEPRVGSLPEAERLESVGSVPEVHAEACWYPAGRIVTRPHVSPSDAGERRRFDPC